MNIYVGNLSYDTSEEKLRDAFAKFGQVDSSRVIMDKHTGRSRGFGFVEMANDSEAQEAVTNLNGSDLDGRTLKVSEARQSGDKRR